MPSPKQLLSSKSNGRHDEHANMLLYHRTVLMNLSWGLEDQKHCPSTQLLSDLQQSLCKPIFTCSIEQHRQADSTSSRSSITVCQNLGQTIQNNLRPNKRHLIQQDQQQQEQQQQEQAAATTMPFELEEALFATAPVGLHCVDANGVILWANQTELNFVGFTKDEYVGQYASSFVYSDQQVEANKQRQQQQQPQLNQNGNNSAVTDDNGNGAVVRENHESAVNLITADDKTLYKEVLKRVTGGNPINDIPVRFVTRPGTVIHLLLDCDGTAILRRGTSASPSGDNTNRYYYRFFTRDDTSRRIQEMRSNVLFQETNRSLQMLDNFMNRSMQQMRAPLTLMEKACDLVTENIEDIDEVIRRNAASMMIQAGATTNVHGSGNSVNSDANGQMMRRSSEQTFEAEADDNGKPHAQQQPSTPNNSNNPSSNAIDLNFSAPLAVALSATLEARSVVALATTLTKDALALVDDITDLCRFDQGRVLLIEKEAVKVRDICLESLMKVPIPVGSVGMVDVILDIQEGAPGRTMTDRSVLQRSLALLLNFAVDAAANAASTPGMGGDRGKVILSVTDAAIGQQHGSKSACKVSIYYTNPPDATVDGSIGIMGMGSSGVVNSSGCVETSATAFASAYTSSGTRREQHNHQQTHTPMGMNNEASSTNIGGVIRGNSFSGKLPSIFGDIYSKPTNDAEHNYHTAQGGSMMRRIRLRETIQGGMTSCRRDKLGLGLSLLYHLVGAQGSDLRYEIVSEPPTAASSNTLGGPRRVVLPSMTKFHFLLPMSLDFPDRLPAEYIVKDDLQGGISQPMSSVSLPARASLLSSSIPPDDGLGSIQQPQQKRAKLSHQQPATAVDPLASILRTNVIGAMDNTLLCNHPDGAAASATAPVESNKVPSNASANAATTATKQYPGVAPGARPLVLVVEDTDVSASLLCMHLRKLNCTSHRAENGEVAIEMLRSAPTPDMYSLILMDLRMPVMDGFEATKVIKGSNASNIPVVALTGETSDENRQRCDEIGFDAYQTKPLKRPQLKELLNNFVPGYTPAG